MTLDEHTTSSSLSSLKDALLDAVSAAEFLSPCSSAQTGQTGSSEEPGSATRSLVVSIDRRQQSVPLSTSLLERLTNDMQRATDRSRDDVLESNRDSNSRGTAEGSPVEDLRLPLSAVRSDDSWASMSVPSMPRSETNEAEVKQEDEGEVAGDESMITTEDQEEVEILQMSVSRSNSDLQRWLRTTMTDALGDGTSTVDSNEALEAMAEVTHQARVGLAPAHHGLRSPFVSRTPSMVQSVQSLQSLDSLSGRYHSELVALSGESDGSYELESLQSETMPIKLEDEEDVKPQVEQRKVEVTVEVITNDTTSITPVNETRLPTTHSKDEAVTSTAAANHWKYVSLVLATYLIANLAHTQINSFVAFALKALSAKPESSTSAHTSPPFNNTVLEDSVDDIYIHQVGTPLPAWVLAAVAAVTILTLSLTFLSVRAQSPSPRSSSRSPLLDQNPVDSAAAPELIAEGSRRYAAGQLVVAARYFNRVVQSGCFTHDKATASEWLGRTRYRLSRLQDSSNTMKTAVAAFERSIRLNPAKATTRASLGRCHFVLGDYDAALKCLKAAVRRDPDLSFAHQYLGKTYSLVDDWSLAEHHLREAIRLDPMSYSTHAFLGERLHQLGRNQEAKTELEQAVQLRADYPAAHVRLAFIATEALDKRLACFHLRKAIASREAGCVDDNLPLTLEAIHGSTPYLALYFSSSRSAPSERIQVLRDALDLYPGEQILSILLATHLRASKSREERHAALAELRQFETTLKRRNERFRGDIYSHGLCALVQLALGKAKQMEAEYGMFFQRLSLAQSHIPTGRRRKFAYLLMALYELKER